ncbi:conserved hypothetical protein [Gloeothece citriformis PCC 7424]|uniref:Uncharacterized protein n=1 Tax=Gloeothece citriformis (strain PCC 7424) TaxID=65393 RepID=B7KCE1_GLOC7|nr:hypothetical protein [Gloeothece citriformis]ACK70246.1 conserved hypothetical protein [Gloeothece citriformis PCC 7424]
MLEVGWYSSKLLVKGKLLRNPGYFYRQSAVGASFGTLLLIGLAMMGLNMGIAIAISSLITGIIMPFLLKDVKMQ